MIRGTWRQFSFRSVLWQADILMESYWNSGYEPETYNFVQFAVSQGYSVFNYDRVGVGKSSKYGSPAAINKLVA